MRRIDPTRRASVCTTVRATLANLSIADMAHSEDRRDLLNIALGLCRREHREVAAMVGVHPSALSRWRKNGMIPEPTLRLIASQADVPDPPEGEEPQNQNLPARGQPARAARSGAQSGELGFLEADTVEDRIVREVVHPVHLHIDKLGLVFDVPPMLQADFQNGLREFATVQQTKDRPAPPDNFTRNSFGYDHVWNFPGGLRVCCSPRRRHVRYAAIEFNPNTARPAMLDLVARAIRFVGWDRVCATRVDVACDYADFDVFGASAFVSGTGTDIERSTRSGMRYIRIGSEKSDRQFVLYDWGIDGRGLRDKDDRQQHVRSFLRMEARRRRPQRHGTDLRLIDLPFLENDFRALALFDPLTMPDGDIEMAALFSLARDRGLPLVRAQLRAENPALAARFDQFRTSLPVPKLTHPADLFEHAYPAAAWRLLARLQAPVCPPPLHFVQMKALSESSPRLKRRRARTGIPASGAAKGERVPRPTAPSAEWRSSHRDVDKPPSGSRRGPPGRSAT